MALGTYYKTKRVNEDILFDLFFSRDGVPELHAPIHFDKMNNEIYDLLKDYLNRKTVFIRISKGLFNRNRYE